MMRSRLDEVRNGVGLGETDPVEQAVKGYEMLVTSPDLKGLRRASCMPAFLLGISGPFITVAGAVYVDGVVCQRLGDMLSLVPPLSTGFRTVDYASPRDELVYKVAHLLRTLRGCLDGLDAEYHHLTPTSSPPQNALCPAPHFSKFSIGAKQYTVTYRSRYGAGDARSARAVFHADVSCTSDEPAEACACIVKFTPRYREDAHRLMEALSAAPELLYCNFEPSHSLGPLGSSIS
ncbi:hypothetical protein HGRIS_005562 [Hohenbuehelia grisea]|uniref:Uncharacterized protein n=1 Tax=Hohenbuehelia grisea TaxID=104357 RepID=A0ABR3JYP1_9AGAR